MLCLQLAKQVSQLATGEDILAAFNAKTSAFAINTALSKLTLPGQLIPTGLGELLHNPSRLVCCRISRMVSKCGKLFMACGNAEQLMRHAAAASPATSANPVTQSSTSSSSHSGLSNGGKTARATVLPRLVDAVIAIIAACIPIYAALQLAFYMSRRNRGPAVASPNNRGGWWRRPFARSKTSGSAVAPAGPSKG